MGDETAAFGLGLACSVAGSLAAAFAYWMHRRGERSERLEDARLERVLSRAEAEFHEMRRAMEASFAAAKRHAVEIDLMSRANALRVKAATIDPASVGIPDLFLADWLEDRGIPAEPLREYARRWSDGQPAAGAEPEPTTEGE